MRNCSHCEVGFTGDLVNCPLCGTVLKGQPVPGAFPVHQMHKPARTARALLKVFSIAAAALIVASGIIGQEAIWEIITATAAVVVNYIFLRNLIVRDPDFLRITERWFLALLAIALLWWLASSAPWVINVAVPGICIAALITNVMLVGAYRDAFVHGYAKYLIYEVVLGFVPLGLRIAGLVSWPWLAYGSAACAVILTALLLILTKDQFRNEISKLFAI